VPPGRAGGGGRRYSHRDVELLREVQKLSQEEGVNLAGIKRIIELERTVDALRVQISSLLDELSAAQAAVEQAAASVHASYRRDLVPVNRRTAITVWRPKPKQ
jgi:MerR family transcriptional regulator/heat shock protein HspR